MHRLREGLLKEQVLTKRDSKMRSYKDSGYSSAVEPQPSKLMTRVRSSLPAPYYWCVGFVLDVFGNANSVQKRPDEKRLGKQSKGRVRFFAHIAQSVEHFLGKEEVTGSIPVMSSIA